MRKQHPLAVRVGGMAHEDPGVNVRLLESAYRNLPTPEGADVDEAARGAPRQAAAAELAVVDAPGAG